MNVHSPGLRSSYPSCTIRSKQWESALARCTLYERFGLTTNPYKVAVRMESDQVAWMKLFELQSCLGWQFGDGPSTDNWRHLQSRLVRTEQKVADPGVGSFGSN